MYDPVTGRFDHLDPFAGTKLAPQSFHKYGYTHNDPVNGIDPTGESVEGTVFEFHHFFPHEFRAEFKNIGVDIDDAKYGWIIDRDFHRILPGNLHGLGWNDEWRVWLRDNPGADPFDVEKKLYEMVTDKKYLPVLGTGKWAPLDYDTWKWLKKDLKEEYMTSGSIGKIKHQVKLPGWVSRAAKHAGKGVKVLGFVSISVLVLNGEVRAATKEFVLDATWPLNEVLRAGIGPFGDLTAQTMIGGRLNVKRVDHIIGSAGGVPIDGKEPYTYHLEMMSRSGIHLNARLGR